MLTLSSLPTRSQSFLRALRLQSIRKSLSKDGRCLLFQLSSHLFCSLFYILPFFFFFYTSCLWGLVIIFPKIQTQRLRVPLPIDTWGKWDKTSFMLSPPRTWDFSSRCRPKPRFFPVTTLPCCGSGKTETKPLLSCHLVGVARLGTFGSQPFLFTCLGHNAS